MNLSDFIKYEEWEDYWCFKPTQELSLETFEDLNTNSWKPPKKGIKIILESNTKSKEPTDKQIQSLGFVKSNQTQIIKSIYNFHQKFIFPLYNSSIDIEDDQIISNHEQTKLVYSIKSIQIPLLVTEKAKYFIINFHFNYDDEHDISFLFKNLNVIDFVGLGDDFIDYQELHENRLNGDNLELMISIYDKPNSSPVFRGKHSINEKIDFEFKKKAYTISAYGEKWSQSFKLFFDYKDHDSKYSLNDIIDAN